MEIKQNIGVRPEIQQRLHLTNELQQAIMLLQLNRLELLALVRQELAENPILEEAQELETDEIPMTRLEETRPEDNAVKEDDDWKKTLEEYRDMGPLPSGTRQTSEDLPPFEATLTRTEDLVDHLMWQLRMSRMPARDKLIAGEIIGNLGENGDLYPAVMESIAERLAIPLADVHKVRRKVQQFDPVGVASLSLEDCLLVQAEVFFPENLLVPRIIREHLPDLVGRGLSLAKSLGATGHAVEEARSLIMMLDPKPGRNFAGEHAQYVTPDVYVERVADEYVVVLNEDGLPKLRLSSYYTGLLVRRIGSDTKDYLKKKIRSAEWFMRSIHQRQNTLRAVSESIVRFQHQFLDNGVRFLKPLVLRDVADDIKMHESTVSRVTTSKYMQTPQGLFPMKFFFNPRIEGRVEGGDLASQAVREKIKAMVAAEQPGQPLSDQQIMDRLAVDGVKIARRTVAKYREQLGILPSAKRTRAG